MNKWDMECHQIVWQINTWASDWWASASKAATVATPFKTVAAFSHAGVRALQWPHHGAKNSTKTIPFELSTCTTQINRRSEILRHQLRLHTKKIEQSSIKVTINFISASNGFTKPRQVCPPYQCSRKLNQLQPVTHSWHESKAKKISIVI